MLAGGVFLERDEWRSAVLFDHREIVGVGLGSLVMLVNVIFLSFFTFGCNSLRHLIGGKLDCFTNSPAAKTRHGLWRRVTMFNHHHMAMAWISLATVGLTDLYIRLACAGVFTDPKIF